MRYFVVPQRIQQNTIIFTEDQMHHMRKVLRLSKGDIVECFDNKGNLYKVKIVKLSRESSFGVVESFDVYDLNKNPKITLLQSYPTLLPKLDLVIEKCTELGVDNFIFYKSKRSQFLAQPSDEKIQRWKKIAIKASEQSQRITVPEIYTLQNIAELDFSTYDSKLILYEKSENQNKNFVKDFSNLIYAVGPEGGWENTEIDLYRKENFTDIKPFNTILRTETAPIAFTAILKFLMG